ncbi:unnamed protein product [Mytilus edulis]|uniref:Reverse transcriptase RNase H-like domain-containing protein n=1 Tax=Mytilus edulis TaxID=6550 RepID=A0A8S3S136_MYTED|nr:unnamed protein product [Mytilus edulis]
MSRIGQSYCTKVGDSESEDNVDIEQVSFLNDNVGPSKLRVVSALRRVSTKQSLYFTAFYKHLPLELSLDTGAEMSMIKATSADNIGVTIRKSNRSALQADGVTPLNIVGECHFTLSRDGIELQLEAIVLNDSDVDKLAGIHFMSLNDVAIFNSKQNRNTRQGYNEAIDLFQASVSMGTVQPPQRKGRMPPYSKNKLVEHQNKFDELECKGVFRKPEDVGISVEYINPSFLVKKVSVGFRLVTTFADVGTYTQLEEKISGMKSADKIIWSDMLREHLEFAQTFLSSRKANRLTKCSDQLWIVTDGSVTKRGIGATLYINRDGKVSLAGFFSAKLRKHQVLWLPCEIEALSIAASVKHFSPFIIQSKLQANVLTDSKPCVQGFEKLCRGEFSASPRVTSFLSVVRRYQVSVNHLSGRANIPSDFASRNAPVCTEPNCQVCCFISRTEDSVVRAVSIQDVLNDEFRLSFTTRSAWIIIQSECPDLRRTHAHLKQGTRF